MCFNVVVEKKDCERKKRSSAANKKRTRARNRAKKTKLRNLFFPRPEKKFEELKLKIVLTVTLASPGRSRS